MKLYRILWDDKITFLLKKTVLPDSQFLNRFTDKIYAVVHNNYSLKKLFKTI